VCPSGVPYGQLLEASRTEVSNVRAERGDPIALVVRFALNRVFTRPWFLGFAMRLAKGFRDSGLAQMAFDAKATEGRFRFALALLLASRSSLVTTKSDVERSAWRAPKRGIRVALLRGCVMEGLFAEVNRATERVLTRDGYELVQAKGQLCCGALHAHAGESETARHLARKNIEAFEASGCDRVIVNSAGCGAAMKEYDRLLADDTAFAERARNFSARVSDISEVPLEFRMSGDAAVTRRVGYDAPCHLIHGQRVADAPIELLERAGLSVSQLPGYESCCGGAGIYNLQHRELSKRILDQKIASIEASGVDVVATGNPGCIMQIGAGLLLEGLKVEVVHPIQLVDSGA
jgi:glycolate oxidase iron-sulfur subunit